MDKWINVNTIIIVIVKADVIKLLSVLVIVKCQCKIKLISNALNTNLNASRHIE